MIVRSNQRWSISIQTRYLRPFSAASLLAQLIWLTLKS